MSDLKDTDVVVIRLQPDGTFKAFVGEECVGEGPSARKLRDRFVWNVKMVDFRFDLRFEK